MGLAQTAEPTQRGFRPMATTDMPDTPAPTVTHRSAANGAKRTQSNAPAHARTTLVDEMPPHAVDTATTPTDTLPETATGAGAPDTANAPAVHLPTVTDIWRAQDVIRPYVYHTPLLHSRTLSEMSGAHVHLKAENLQRSGSYKLRGATYKMSRLSAEERARGVIAASAGNHAQAVAIAATALGIPSTVVMPVGASLAKVTATQSYGARIVLHGASYDEAYAKARELQAQTGATYIHAFDDPDIISGQGTVGLEILADQPDVEVVIVAIGGGGLISGVATAVKTLKPDVRIIGVEAAGAASMRAALDAGHPLMLPTVNTIADGIATKAAGAYTYAAVQSLVDEVVTVDDEAIVRSVLLLLERCKLLVEGAGAVSVAALLSGMLDIAGKRTVAILSGGNIDMNLIGKFIQHGLSAQGRYLVIRTLIPDRPGELLRLLSLIAEQNVNVLDIEHHRTSPGLSLQQVEVMLTLETRDRAHCATLLDLLGTRGYAVKEMRPDFNLMSGSQL